MLAPTLELLVSRKEKHMQGEKKTGTPRNRENEVDRKNSPQ
ncbi:hypothetical protein HMPREF3187_01650 [Aerococcus christensenii]|uniref:Uncharacterized protein n=1 Tax=Aerococcus christensenii TaxID=87541 RepID=A0A133XRT4_9LACT|nr:hypothetical protein HMPREF3187_01650 [Aerococcus christensenii]